MAWSFVRRRLAVGVCGVGGLLGVLPSCGGASKSSDDGHAGANEKALFLVGVVAREPGMCQVAAVHDSRLLAKGVLDLAFSSSYTAVLLVGNQFQAAKSTPSAPETERVALSSAEITLRTASGAALGSYTTVGTGFVDAAADSSAYGSMTVTIVPTGLSDVASLQGTEPLVATIRVQGEALDGTTMTSSALTFPIDVCTGCLVKYPAEAADPTISAGSTYMCSFVATSVSQMTEPEPCVMGQDTAFSCVLCAASDSLCRDPTQNPAFQ